MDEPEKVIIEKLDKIEEMAKKLDLIRKDRLSEVDEILALFQGELGLNDILNQDYSLITDLANVRDEKIASRLKLQKGHQPPKSLLDHVSEDGVKDRREKTTKSSASKNKRSV